MTRTALEIQTDIDNLQAALQDLYLGKRLTTLIIGTGDSQRRYSYQEITKEKLQEGINDLRAELLSVSASAEPVFRSYASMPIIINKVGV